MEVPKVYLTKSNYCKRPVKIGIAKRAEERMRDSITPLTFASRWDVRFYVEKLPDFHDPFFHPAIDFCKAYIQPIR